MRASRKAKVWENRSKRDQNYINRMIMLQARKWLKSYVSLKVVRRKMKRSERRKEHRMYVSLKDVIACLCRLIDFGSRSRAISRLITQLLSRKNLREIFDWRCIILKFHKKVSINLCLGCRQCYNDRSMSSLITLTSHWVAISFHFSMSLEFLCNRHRQVAEKVKKLYDKKKQFLPRTSQKGIWGMMLQTLTWHLMSTHFVDVSRATKQNRTSNRRCILIRTVTLWW